MTIPSLQDEEEMERGGNKNREGAIGIVMARLKCSSLQLPPLPKSATGASSVYWTVSWGDGSHGDHNFQSPAAKVSTDDDGGMSLWEFSGFCTSRRRVPVEPPRIRVDLNDHICFEFFHGGGTDAAADAPPKFLGSVIYPIEDLIVSGEKTSDGLYHFEEIIGSDDGGCIGHLDAYVKINRG